MPHNTDLADLDAFITNRITNRKTEERIDRKVSFLSRLLISFSFRKHSQPSKKIVCRLCDQQIDDEYFEKHSQQCSNQQDLLSDQQEIDRHLQTVCTLSEQRGSQELYKIARSALIAGGGHYETVIMALAKLNYKLTKLQLQSSDDENVDRLMFLLKYKQDIYKSLNSIKSPRPGKTNKRSMLWMVLKRLQKTPTDNPIVYTIPSINDFDLVRSLSKGAFGSVYLCRHKKTKDLFAIKAIQKVDSNRKNTIAHALTERRALTLIDSPWIVPLYFAFQSEHHLFLVMEYMCGGDLRALLKVHRRITSLDSVRFYAAELVIAVDQLHRANIIHHDLKPENILIGHDGHIKLIDLGLSRSSSEAAEIQNSGRLGTPDYMAPEIVDGEPSSTAADVWAIGCVIYELYFGEPPFHADTVEKIFDKIKNGYNADRHDPTPLDHLIWTLLQQDPVKRPTLEDIKDHPFFEAIKWSNRPEQVSTSIPPPFIPKPQHDEDTCYFDICKDQADQASVIDDMQAAHPMFSVHSLDGNLDSSTQRSFTGRSPQSSPGRSSFSDFMSTTSLSGNSSNASLASNQLAPSPQDFAYKNLDLLEALNRKAMAGRSSGNSSPLRRSAAFP